MTWLRGLPDADTDWDRLSAVCPDAVGALSEVVAAAWEEADPVLLELARLRIAKLLGHGGELARRSARARDAGLSRVEGGRAGGVADFTAVHRRASGPASR